MSEYPTVERLLHRIALGFPTVGQATLDLELKLARPDLHSVEQGRHVLDAGLARAGTSVLLRLLAGTGQFAVQIYREPRHPMITMRQIEAFHTTMASGSATEAARAIGVSQAAVSRMLADLERRWCS